FARRWVLDAPAKSGIYLDAHLDLRFADCASSGTPFRQLASHGAGYWMLRRKVAYISMRIWICALPTAPAPG
ncbi:hypothetical protein ACSP98_28010, partial [Klebsiella pneumoniae]